jgi:hypothetical protein
MSPVLFPFPLVCPGIRIPMGSHSHGFVGGIPLSVNPHV